MDVKSTSRTGAAALSAAVALAMLAGCEPAATPKTDSPAASSVPRNSSDRASGDGRSEVARSGSKAAQAVDDTAITAAVKAGILAEPGLKVLQIAVDSSNGIVTLSGSVEEPDSVKKAAQIASAVQGVRSVDNRLVVNSTKRS